MVQPNGRPNARVGKRPTVAVVYDDVSKGYRCADWFALHGYQATMTSTVHPLEQNLKELRPDLIVVGFSSILTGLNFIVTIHRMRAPGLTWAKCQTLVPSPSCAPSSTMALSCFQ